MCSCSPNYNKVSSDGGSADGDDGAHDNNDFTNNNDFINNLIATPINGLDGSCSGVYQCS